MRSDSVGHATLAAALVRVAQRSRMDVGASADALVSLSPPPASFYPDDATELQRCCIIKPRDTAQLVGIPWFDAA